jgi:hypothetical protein
MVNGAVDTKHVQFHGKHSRGCCFKSGVDPKTYGYEGKEDEMDQRDVADADETENMDPNRDLDDLEEPVAKKQATRAINCQEEMRCRIVDLVNSEHSFPPKKIHDIVQKEMDEKYPKGHIPMRFKTAINLAKNTKAGMNIGDKISTVENSREYNRDPVTEMPFLQSSMRCPNPDPKEDHLKIMLFANHELLGYLKLRDLDVYVNATFNCVPHPFTQCLIFMIYDMATSSYVPIVYALMDSKCKEAYWHVFNQIIVLSGWKLQVKTFCTDFERALFDEMKTQFGGKDGGTHIECFFHLKQAWRKYLLKKCHIDRETVKVAMRVGMLDLLCVIPAGEVESHGIPYLRSLLGANLTLREHKKWEKFWQYFERQWLRIVSSWNIAHMDNDDDGERYDLINRTNNGLERYNRHYNGLFDSKPDLFQFVRILQQETRNQVQKLDDIRKGRRNKVDRDLVTIPLIPNAYIDFRDSYNLRPVR